MSIGKLKNDFINNDEFSKLKYSKQPNLLDGTKIELPKHTSKEVFKPKQKYTAKKSEKLNSKLDKSSKIKAKRAKKQRLSDPEVSSISVMMSNSLLIKSPEKSFEKNVQTKSKNENKNNFEPKSEKTKDIKLIDLKNTQSPLSEIKTVFNSKTKENSDYKSTKLKKTQPKNVQKQVDTDSNEIELTSKKLTKTNSKLVKTCDSTSKPLKSKTKNSKLGKYSPKLRDPQTKMSQDQNESKETPTKINAFAFMMGNRNKVIGTNSDGKDKEEEVLTSPEIVKEKKQKLGKRKEILENWAEKKVGANKRKLDEAQEKYIARTLNKRAKRMKKMLNISDEDSDEVIVKKQTKKIKNRKAISIDSPSSNDDDNTSHSMTPEQAVPGILSENPGTSNEHSNAVPKQKILKNTKQANISEKNNINSTIEANKAGNKILEISDENTPKITDENSEQSEFLDEIFPNSDLENEDSVSPKIKIKMNFSPKKHVVTPKTKKKSKCALSSKKSTHKSKTQSIHVENEDIDEIFPKTPKQLVSLENKSKLDGNTKTPPNQSKLVNNSSLGVTDSKSEQVQQFTPRTWRMRVRLFEKENLGNEIQNETDVIVVDESPTKLMNIEHSPSSFSNSAEKQMKLAPLFLRKSRKDEQAALQAKKNFLYSASPSTKKIKAKQPSDPEIIFNYFPKVSHVQQRLTDTDLDIFWDLPCASLCTNEDNIDTIKITNESIAIGTFTDCKPIIHAPLKRRPLHAAPIKLQNTKQLIQEIKNENESYPVFKIFRQLHEKRSKIISINAPPVIKKLPEIILKRKRGRSKINKAIVSDDTSETTPNQKVDVATVESFMWTEKYKPQSRDDIIGNSFSVDELKSWLSAWLIYSEDKNTVKRKRFNSNSSDDFCSDSSTRDTETIPQNTIILTGPYGSGKTASVYALSNELSINVIEINASSKRTGKKILSELQEATQSHQVKNTESKAVGSYFQNKTEEDSNKRFSLLLVEDIDIVFEDQDDGFLSALGTLVTTSKRPMIFTTTDPNSSNLQKFVLQHRVLIFNPFTANTIGTWLQILCLVENLRVNKSTIVRLLQWNKGDIRKTILQLQFWTQTGGDQLKLTENETLPRIVQISTGVNLSRRNSIERDALSQDDNSNLSWLSENDVNAELRDHVHQSVIESFVPYYERDREVFQISYPANLGTIWWNMSNILNTPEPQRNNVYELESQTPNAQIDNMMIIDDIYCSVGKAPLSPLLFETKELPVNSSRDELNQVKSLLDSMAFADIVYTRLKVNCDFEPTVNYWQVVPSDSLSFSENLATYDASNNVSMEIVHWLLENNIKHVQKKTDCDVNVSVPASDKIRRRTKQHSSMEELLVLVPSSYVLDRRAICEDYQPMLRLISRIEAHRFFKNNKRKARFYHYLKNLNLHLSNSTILALCNTLAIDKHTF